MIEFRNVFFSYGESAEGELKDINLTIPSGQCVLLCGRSGCGKTTLTRLINGLIPQFFAGELSGEVLLDGEDVTSLPMYKLPRRWEVCSRIRGRSFSTLTRTVKLPSGWKMKP